MPTAAKKQAHSALPASQKKAPTPKKPAKKQLDHLGGPHSQTHLEELKTQLGYFIKPDFQLGDYWAKLDLRLYQKLPDLILKTLDALEAKYPAKKMATQKSSKCHGRSQ